MRGSSTIIRSLGRFQPHSDALVRLATDTMSMLGFIISNSTVVTFTGRAQQCDHWAEVAISDAVPPLESGLSEQVSNMSNRV